MAVGISLSSPAEGEADVPEKSRYGPWVAVTIPTVIGLFGAVGCLVVVRRLAGALHEQTPRDALLLTALIATTTMVAARIAWQRAFADNSFRTDRPCRADLTFRTGRVWDLVVGWGSSAALALLALGSCYPANRTSDWLIWLPLLVV